MFTFFLKEIRQLRRDMVFWGTLIVQIMLCALVIAFLKFQQHLMGNATLPQSEGAFFSHTYDSIGLMAAMIVLIAMAMRWHNDMNDDALNPVVTTPLPPSAVVAGKYLATWIAVLAPLAVSQVFILSTIPKDLFDLYIKFRLPMNVAVMAAVSAALLTVSPLRCKSGFLCAILPGMVLLLLMMLVWMPESLMKLMFADRKTAQFPQLAYTMLKVLLPVPMMFALTIAAVSAPSSDRAIPVRLTLLGTLAAYLIVFCFENPGFTSRQLAEKAAGLCGAGACFAVVASVAERRAQSSRVLAAIRRAPAVLRPLRILCSTGAIPELVFSLLLLAAYFILKKAGIGDSKDELFPFAYATLIFCAVLAQALSSLIQLVFKHKSRVWLRFIFFYAANFVLTTVISISSTLNSTDLDVVMKYLTTCSWILGGLSLVLLIPVAIDFAKSLKQRS